ncbi:hypothetical protein [Amycolatopsis marina]|uniref:hypothetical protein n=1 Tax=Amycolatopsis marina TaxID=490629 RepID=UPI0015A67CD0|nr:hypothetical protein [Amycolatopsis marina]
MNLTTEPETMGELIADCSEIPRDLRREGVPTPRHESARPWSVDDACHAQVADLDAYV